MRHEAMPSDLAILSAEQYLDGSLTGKTGKAKKPPTSKPETSPRKRAKISPPAAETESAEDGEDDGAKRARGRPRLDTKDQTAAEVGRTSFVLSSHCSPINRSVSSSFSRRGFVRASRATRKSTLHTLRQSPVPRRSPSSPSTKCFGDKQPPLQLTCEDFTRTTDSRV